MTSRLCVLFARVTSVWPRTCSATASPRRPARRATTASSGCWNTSAPCSRSTPPAGGAWSSSATRTGEHTGQLTTSYMQRCCDGPILLSNSRNVTDVPHGTNFEKPSLMVHVVKSTSTHSVCWHFFYCFCALVFTSSHFR